MNQRGKNWGGNVLYGARDLKLPASLEELQETVATTPRLRPLGTRHSFNGLADTAAVQVSLDAMEQFVEVDDASATARVSGWSTYGHIAPALHDHGFALPNLASLPHISVAGACATATHGSGVRRRNLAAAVSAMEFVDGNGELVTVSRSDDPDVFPGCVVHLGALGIVTALTLDLVPARPVHQRAYVDLARSELAANLDAIMAGADSVSCFTRWQDDVVDTVLHKDVRDPDDDPTELFGAARATGPRHPILGLATEAVTQQLGNPGPWHERLPHFRLEHTPSAGEEIQSEWFVDRRDAANAIEAVWRVGPHLDDALQVSEIRTIAADDLWLSPMYERDVLALHFTWILDPPVVDHAIRRVEDALAPFDAVPHWGKLSHADRDLYASRYERLADFVGLAERFDPDRRFRNDFLDDLLGGAQPAADSNREATDGMSNQ